MYEKNRKNFFVELLKDKGIDAANIGDTEISLSVKDVQSKKRRKCGISTLSRISY